jgi:uncharacterized protein YqgC (DUF456 family)
MRMDVGIEIAVTVLAGILLIVAAVGTVYPVLPGSILAIVTLLVWAWVMGSPFAWVAAAVGVILAAVGWSASAVLTGRTLKKRQVPKRSIAVAMVCAVIGMFLIPVVGLFVGFAVGLLVSEYVRHRDVRAALASSLDALKATGIGILVEFTMVCLAASVWVAGVAAHFATR